MKRPLLILALSPILLMCLLADLGAAMWGVDTGFTRSLYDSIPS